MGPTVKPIWLMSFITLTVSIVLASINATAKHQRAPLITHRALSKEMKAHMGPTVKPIWLTSFITLNVSIVLASINATAKHQRAPRITHPYKAANVIFMNPNITYFFAASMTHLSRSYVVTSSAIDQKENSNDLIKVDLRLTDLCGIIHIVLNLSLSLFLTFHLIYFCGKLRGSVCGRARNINRPLTQPVLSSLPRRVLIVSPAY